MLTHAKSKCLRKINTCNKCPGEVQWTVYPLRFDEKCQNAGNTREKWREGALHPLGVEENLKKQPKRLFPSHGRLDISIRIALQLYWITLLEFAGRFQR